MNKQRLFTFLWLSLLVAGLLVACGEVPTVVPVTLSSTTAAPTAVSTVAGGTFRWTLAIEPDSLDPATVYAAEGINIVQQLFDGVTEFDKDLNIQPALAESWTTSTDGLTTTFKLRRNAKFSNGDPVKAQDFLYSWNRVLQNEKSESAYYFEEIKGYAELTALKGAERQKATLSGLKAPDDYTLEVTFNRPTPDFLSKATLSPFRVVNRSVIEKFGSKWTEAGNLIGTGAFVLKEWKHNESLKLDANPNYWGNRPTIDGVTIQIIADLEVALQKYEKNELDSIQLNGSQVLKVRNNASLKNELAIVPSARTNFISFNFTKGPFATNKELRKAFYQAIDSGQITKTVLQGAGLPLTTLLLPGLPGYKIYEVNPFNPTKAKASLAAAGYDTPEKVKQLEDSLNAGEGGGFAFTPARAGWQQVSESYIEQIKQNLGITLKPNPVATVADYFKRRNSDREFLIFFGSWAADYPDPVVFYKPLFGCNIEGAAGGGYCNKDLDEVLKAAESERNQDKRFALYQQAEKILQDDAAMIPVFSSVYSLLTKPTVRNWKFNTIGPASLKIIQFSK